MQENTFNRIRQNDHVNISSTLFLLQIACIKKKEKWTKLNISEVIDSTLNNDKKQEHCAICSA
jgi:hypothetical protein